MAKSNLEKPLFWIASSKKDLLSLSDEVIDDFGYSLGAVQLGKKPLYAKPWKGEGVGVMELVTSTDGNTFRAIYTVKFELAVYVLHCLQKIA